MSSLTVYDAVAALLTGTWSATPLVFDNETKDTTGHNPTKNNDPWILVEMSSDFYGAASVGAGSDSDNLYRETGLIEMTVMVQSGTGSRIARQHATDLIALFRGRELLSGRLRFRNLAIGKGGVVQRPDGNWFGLPCSADYQADQ